MKDPSILLEVHNLTIAANQESVWIDLVKGISFELVKSQTLVIVGEPGCWKSLTVKAIMRLLPQPDIKIFYGKLIRFGVIKS
jgi:ABC-type dipeptide/oligopeptide/nickel transport system ATPase component